MKKVLLTGIDGFTGKYIKDELISRGYDVIGLVYKEKEPKLGQIACDITDKKSLQACLNDIRPNYIIHLAALSFVAHKDQKAFYDVNLFGSLNLLEAAKNIGLTLDKVIMASSANIYGNPENVRKITEDIPPSPVSHYAMSKLSMEYMTRLWFDSYPIIITRPFNYTGVGQEEHFLIPKIVSHFKNGKDTIELGNTHVARDFSDVRDIAKAYVALLESNVSSETINLCSGNVYYLNDIISKLEDIAGYNINVTVNPDFVRPNEIEVLGGDNYKLEKIVGFKPTINIEKTLSDMFYA
ncbi:GDP-mannose 4,6-dehydratase [Vibrio rhizosphaerae]|uniref:GDP-mannose 4,6-dehydratase n=1 Tax=Vibrio rhizosphaerae TaxID=398736 RepID=A0ABU4IQ93_9VIBR|nr:GDP-mannose 4,6-dehydratase [Vibrio rhizosphaerae]MDW6091569.1 GDP-mannose 4,6-dehydratase [Vibrio rhizosphaerae]